LSQHKGEAHDVHVSCMEVKLVLHDSFSSLQTHIFLQVRLCYFGSYIIC